MDTTAPTPAANNIINNAPKAKIPPIVVGNQFYEQLINLLNKYKVTQYTLKLTSIGIRINLSEIDAYKTLLTALKSPTDGLNFYTHDLFDKPLKFVLKGLPVQQNFDQIINKLASINLVADDIKQMTVKAPAFTNQALYIVYFKKGSTHINDLKKITNIDNIAVNWQSYRSPKGPTQCHNCQMFGHGSRNCSLAPKCVKCAGTHLTSTCTADCNVNNKQHLKCANCNQKHAASFTQCPSRLEYINLRMRQSTNAPAAPRQPAANIPHVVHRRNPVQVPPPDHSNFPTLPTTNPLASTSRQLPSSNLAAGLANARQTNDPVNQAEHDPLFTTQELLHIFKQLVAKLKACNSRIDQINVITEVAINYCLLP